MQHQHIDLRASAAEQASQLSGITADYVFFAAYLQDSDEQKLCDINGAMLQNFLDALSNTGAAKSLKRVILVTGAKQYGVHLGPVKQPMEESDPWLEGPDYPPNFYYVQQRILASVAKESGSKWDWTVTYPNDVLGVASGNFMNLPLTLSLYALVSRDMNGAGGALEFPGSEVFYRDCFDCLTYAPLHAEFCEWAATAEAASNEAFNVVNGDAVSYSTLWPKIAERFGMTVPPRMFEKPGPIPMEMKLQEKPPAADQSATASGLEGHVSQGKVQGRIDLMKWTQREDVKAAWEKVAAREGLEKDAFEKATWGFLNFVLGRSYNLIISMSKARKAGWNGYIDTWEALNKCFDGLVEEGALPKNI